MEILLHRSMVSAKEHLLENDNKLSKKSLMVLSKQCALGKYIFIAYLCISSFDILSFLTPRHSLEIPIGRGGVFG